MNKIGLSFLLFLGLIYSCQNNFELENWYSEYSRQNLRETIELENCTVELQYLPEEILVAQNISKKFNGAKINRSELKKFWRRGFDQFPGDFLKVIFHCKTAKLIANGSFSIVSKGVVFEEIGRMVVSENEEIGKIEMMVMFGHGIKDLGNIFEVMIGGEIVCTLSITTTYFEKTKSLRNEFI